MITNFLLDHAALVPVALLVLALVCACAGPAVLRRPRLLRVLLALSVLPVLALTLVPDGSRTDRVACTVQFAVPTPGSVELLANVALFLPPVFLATLATRRPLPTAAAGSGLSAVIEALQALVPAVGRACDTGDWLMNTAGAVLGALLAVAVLAAVRRAGRPGGAASR